MWQKCELEFKGNFLWAISYYETRTCIWVLENILRLIYLHLRCALPGHSPYLFSIIQQSNRDYEKLPGFNG